jgi:hypothetical protein
MSLRQGQLEAQRKDLESEILLPVESISMDGSHGAYNPRIAYHPLRLR